MNSGFRIGIIHRYIIGFVGLLLVNVGVMNATTQVATTGWSWEVDSPDTAAITAHTICKRYAATNNQKVFVPIKTPNEWQTFYTSNSIKNNITECISSVNGTCSSVVNKCTTGLPIGYSSGSCGGITTWNCAGIGTGTTANCSQVNPSCGTSYCPAGQGWDSITHQCITNGTARISYCSAVSQIPQHSSATIARNEYAQAWNGNAWSPNYTRWKYNRYAINPSPKIESMNSTMTNTNISQEQCVFDCDVGYSWNANVNECQQNELSTCTGLIPVNAIPNSTGSGYIRSWYTTGGSSSNFIPEANLAYHYGYNTDVCTYQCKSGYSWNGFQCLPNPTSSCTGTLPSGTHIYGTNGIYGPNYDQSYQSDGSLYPQSNIAYHLYSSSSVLYCAYECDPGLVWNGNSCITDQIVNCSGNQPTHSVLTAGSTYRQQYQSDGSLLYPLPIAYHHEDISPNYCIFQCESGYSWNGFACMPNLVATCGGGAQPLNSQIVWGLTYGPTYIQKYQSDGSMSPASGIGWHFGSFPMECGVYCMTGYSWNDFTNACILNPAAPTMRVRLVSCGGSIPSGSLQVSSSVNYAQVSYDPLSIPDNSATWTPTGIMWSLGGSNISLPDGVIQNVCNYQ